MNNSISLTRVVSEEFNEILYPHEKTGLQCPNRHMEAFRETLDVCGLIDLGFDGYHYDGVMEEQGMATSKRDWTSLWKIISG